MADRLREPFPGTVDHIFPLGLAPENRRDGFCVVHVEDGEGNGVVGYRVAEIAGRNRAPFGVVFPDAGSATDLAGQLNADLAIEGQEPPMAIGPSPLVPAIPLLAGSAGAVGVYARGSTGKGDEDEDEEHAEEGGHAGGDLGSFDDTDAAIAIESIAHGFPHPDDDDRFTLDSLTTQYACLFLAEAVETGQARIGHEPLIPEGRAILRYQSKVVDEHTRHARMVTINGTDVPAVNATVLFSEIAGKLAESAPFGVAYFDRADGKRQYSLRSRGEGGIDVSEVAKAFGGGGHRNAAGFELPIGVDPSEAPRR